MYISGRVPIRGKPNPHTSFGGRIYYYLGCSISSIEAFRQSYFQFVGGELYQTYASFHGWFTTSLTAFLREALNHALEDFLQSTDSLDGRLDRFRDVLIPDTTAVTLYQSLIDTYRGYGDDHAGAKLHVVESVSTGVPTQFSITDACIHESTQLVPVGGLLARSTCTIRAFFDYQTMDLVDTNDGWFVTRFTPNANHVSSH